MGSAVPLVVKFISCIVEGGGHKLVLLPPVTKDVVPGIIDTILQIYAQRLRLGFPYYCRVFIATPHCHKGTHRTVYPGEEVRPLPGNCECGNAAAAGTCNCAVIRVGGDEYFPAVGKKEPFHKWDDFCLYECCKAAVCAVKLVAAVVAENFPILAVACAGLQQYGNCYRHLPAPYQIGNYRCRTKEVAVQSKGETRRCFAVIFLGNHHLYPPFCAGVYF